MRKQFIAAVLCGLFITGLAGCGNQPQPSAETVPDSTVTVDDTSGVEMSDSIPAEPTEPTESEELAESAASEPQQSAEKETAESEPASQQTKPTIQAEAQKAAEPIALQQLEQKPAPTEPDNSTALVQQEPKPTPEEAKPKTAYDYEFDMEAIKADCIGIGQSMGLTLDSSLTPNNASWWNPVTASSGNQGEALKQSLVSYITFHTTENLSAYGIDEITSFNIYCEARGNGAYAIYFLFA